MFMGLVVLNIINEGGTFFLGVEAEDGGGAYSSWTGGEPAYLESTWLKLSAYLGTNPDHRLTIFESEHDAREYVSKYKRDDIIYGIIRIENLFKYLEEKE